MYFVRLDLLIAIEGIEKNGRGSGCGFIQVKFTIPIFTCKERRKPRKPQLSYFWLRYETDISRMRVRIATVAKPNGHLS